MEARVVLQGNIDVLRPVGKGPAASIVIEHSRVQACDVGRRNNGFRYDEHLMLRGDDSTMTDHKQLVPVPAANTLGIAVIVEVKLDACPARKGGRVVLVRHASLLPEDRDCAPPS